MYMYKENEVFLGRLCFVFVFCSVSFLWCVFLSWFRRPPALTLRNSLLVECFVLLIRRKNRRWIKEGDGSFYFVLFCTCASGVNGRGAGKPKNPFSLLLFCLHASGVELSRTVVVEGALLYSATQTHRRPGWAPCVFMVFFEICSFAPLLTQSEVRRSKFQK